MDYKERAREILREWVLCSQAKPKNNVVDIQIEKDVCGRWATNLIHNLNWGSEIEIIEACNQLDTRLQKLKKHIVIEVLTNGTI